MLIRRSWLLFAFVAACGSPAASPSPREARPTPTAFLRPPDWFSKIADKGERSRALFTEAARVMRDPRCTNCHPDGDSPMQGDLGSVHDPPVVRGPDDSGVVGMECGSCHQDRNSELARVPGAPKWRLAPRSMAWARRTPAALCEQLKDPSRNGNRSLAAIAEHAAHDPLVAWGWAPGHRRLPVLGSQAVFGQLVAAWIETGAECPSPEVHR